jgi:DNA repair ATPase RecN
MNSTEIAKYISGATSKAANFKRVDLQIHSDESGDFPRAEEYGSVRFDPTTDDSAPVSPLVFLERAENKQLDVIAITDHMRSRRSCEIASLSMNGARSVLALPAIEVNISLAQISNSTKDGVHLLCIFKEGKSPEDIEKIFHCARGLSAYDQRQVSEMIHADIRDFVQGVHSNDGICIASHVNAEKGLRRAFFSVAEINYLTVKLEREALKKEKSSSAWSAEKDIKLKKLEANEKTLADQIQNSYLSFLFEAGIDGVQIQKSTEEQFYRGEHCAAVGIRPIATLLTSDAHCTSAIGYEKKITFIKMTSPSWQSLKLALKDPEVRIRYSDTVGVHAYPKIKGLVFMTSDGYFKGFSGGGTTLPLTLGFADNLTCLIGGRGAGKSAAIDALRYVFKNKTDVASLPDHLRNDIYGRLSHTLKDTTLFLQMQGDDGEDVIVKSFYTDWGRRTYESHFMNGEEAGIDLSTSTKYRAEIYGWNEIETLGTDSVKQLGLLDRFSPSIPNIVKKLEENKNALQTNRSKIVDAARKLEKRIPNVKEFEEAKSAYEKTNTPEMQGTFAELDKILGLKKIVEDSVSEVAKIKNQFSTSHAIKDSLNEIAARLPEGEVRERVFGINDSLITQAADAHTQLLGVLVKIVQALEAEQDSVKRLESDSLSKLTALAGGDAKNVSSLDKRQARKKKYDDLVVEKERISKEREQLKEDLRMRRGLLATFEALQQERSSARVATKDEINGRLASAIRRGPRIAIDFSPLGNRTELERKLGTTSTEPASPRETGILKNLGLKYLDRRFAEIISSNFGALDFVAVIIEGRQDGLVATHRDQKDSIDLEASQRIFQHLTPDCIEFGETYYRAEKLSTLLELQEIELDDRPEITLDSQPITGLSPGQRCSALVPIILLQGNHPLIIDQPEDNLDNRLVFDLVVEILRNLKESRQIIVATHNPNIPVSGDAEQIIVFEPINRNAGRIVVQGSINENDVIEAVKDIMEGGSEAFLTRARKYRYELES